MSKTHPDPKEEILPGVEAEDFDGLRPTSDYQACVSSGLPADLLSRAQGNYVWAIDELMTKDDLQEFAWPNVSLLCCPVETLYSLFHIIDPPSDPWDGSQLRAEHGWHYYTGQRAVGENYHRWQQV